MNKRYLYIAGFILLAVTASGLFAFNINQKQPTADNGGKEEIIFVNTINGKYKKAVVIDTVLSPQFSETKNTFNASHIQNNRASNITLYEITFEDNQTTSIEVNKDKRHILFSGMEPQSIIRATQSSNKILKPTPSDWAGRLRLSNISDTNNMCFELQNRDIKICHAVSMNKEGMS